MSSAVPEWLQRLRDDYLRDLPGRVGELQRALDALIAAPREPAALAEARRLAHQIHGTAGSYGLSALGEAAGRIEAALSEEGGASAEAAVGLGAGLLQALRDAQVEAPRSATSSGPRLLLCSQDATMLRELGELGHAQLWEILVAPSAAEALELAARARPHAALLDASDLAPAEALRLAEALRALQLPEPLPIAIAAASVTLEVRVSAARAGASLCLEKPLDRSWLAHQLEALFAESRALREPVSALVLHEDAVHRDSTLALLRSSGLLASAIDEPSSLLEALEQRRPDALILGERLPGLDGADACRALRCSLRWRELPVLLAASGLSEETRLRAAEAGADGTLDAPLAGPALAARLRALVLRARVQRERADTDALTGLLLRRPFLDRLAARLAESRRARAPLAVCLLDLDGFKDANTRLGHLGADRVLSAFGRLLLGTLRLEDLRCRWGGDEFALAFPGQSPEAALLALRRIEPRARAIALDGASEPVAFSAGVACFPGDGADAAALLGCADERLYRAKALGRGRCVAG